MWLMGAQVMYMPAEVVWWTDVQVVAVDYLCNVEIHEVYGFHSQISILQHSSHLYVCT